mmetsp:Transcript_18206/g.16498  ORF Transcript_18206/g.16498 Transcript_18206/m.16498 type:complete len:673 (+) Transcript_18206:3-2021(+)
MQYNNRLNKNGKRKITSCIPQTTKGIVYFLLLLSVLLFTILIFLYCLYHSHLQLSDLSNNTSNKQFINNITNKLLGSRLKEQATQSSTISDRNINNNIIYDLTNNPINSPTNSPTNYPTNSPTNYPTITPTIELAIVENNNTVSLIDETTPENMLPPAYNEIIGKKYNQVVNRLPPVHTLTCPHGDLLSFWRAPTKNDIDYVSPYATYGPEDKYVTFEPDFGGWNNIRMQMELILVFALATGRTLVLPADQPMYLLHHGKGHQKVHSFADFFPFDIINQRVKVISMKEYLEREGLTNHLSIIPKQVEFDMTNKQEKNYLWGYLRNVSSCPLWKCMTEYLVIPKEPGRHKHVNYLSIFKSENRGNDPIISLYDYLSNYTTDGLIESNEINKNLYTYLTNQSIDLNNNLSIYSSIYYSKYLTNQSIYIESESQKIFSSKRIANYYDNYWQSQRYIHFISNQALDLRLLEHFYTFLYFEDEKMDRYYKRFVRDYVHYIDTIFCKAAVIIKHLLDEGNGSFTSFHIRRGEFQYKEVKISASELMHNVGHLIPSNELLYLATDEKNKSFFNDMLIRFPKIRYLDDYVDTAGLVDINPNYLGMIDQVVCTRGTQFIGTWFSTFSGYITRMRGYLGYHDYSVWYGDKTRRDRFHHAELPKFPFYMREWNLSWANIDEVY